MMITNEQLELMSVSEASKLTGLARATIAHAMDAWEISKGRFGLRFVQPTTRRLVRKSALLDWMTNLERSAASGI